MKLMKENGLILLKMEMCNWKAMEMETMSPNA